MVGVRVNMNSGGTGPSGSTRGSRLGIYSTVNVGDESTNDVTNGQGNPYSAIWGYAYAKGNVGGTPNKPWGSLWGSLSSCALLSGATYWNGCTGEEVDVGVNKDASAAFIQGVKVVLTRHDVKSHPWDYMIGMAKSATSAGTVQNGISFGSPDGYWPIDPTGTLINTNVSGLAGYTYVDPITGNPAPAYPPPARQAADGVDMSGVTFSDAAFKSKGFSVDPVGAVHTTGLVLDGSAVPSSSTSPCVKGQISVDQSYVYVCIGTNQWARAALEKW